MEAKKMNQILMKAFGELSPESRPFVANLTNEVTKKHKPIQSRNKKLLFGL